MKKACSIIVCVLSNAAVFFAAERMIDLIRNSNQPKVSGVLYIEPLVTVADLLIAIGLIGLGLSGLAVIITVEYCYFRKGGTKRGETLQNPTRPAQGKRHHLRCAQR